MAEKLEALRRDGWGHFWGNENPVCPHCGSAQNVQRNEWWSLYEEGEHEVTCTNCDNDFNVSTRVSYSFNTDEQPEPASPSVAQERQEGEM
jgi:hypothetical protein